MAVVAHKGNNFRLSVYSARKQIEVMDSRASDHMTGDGSLFHQYSPCKEDYSIRIADGSLSKVARMGFMMLSSHLTLYFILYVPNLDCYLLSVSCAKIRTMWLSLFLIYVNFKIWT